MRDELMISAEQMRQVFQEILSREGFEPSKAKQCAHIFASNSIDGVYTHGVNRFARFIKDVREGIVNTAAAPSLKNQFGNVEQWDGRLGAGVLNAAYATERAMALAREKGLGCACMANTNHWMRAGHYGWMAAKEGFAFIGWTNTIANMPAWKAVDNRLGNNPLVLAMPHADEAIVLDMAMSQYSFGSMEMKAMRNEKLAVYGGFDKNGNLTMDPSDIIESKRPLPIGYWKGAGLSLLLDLMASILSGGRSTHEISKQNSEYGVSQVFICFDLAKFGETSFISQAIESIINDYHLSMADRQEGNVVYPGERVLFTRKKNMENGIPVMRQVWEEIILLTKSN